MDNPSGTIHTETEVLALALLERLPSSSFVAQIVISLAAMLLGGFLMTRLTKLLRLPNVTAYILCGILLGPYCIHLVPADVMQGMSFLSDVALAFIAFGVGEFFRLSVLRKNGGKVAVITLLEALTASLLVFVLTYWILRLPLAFSVVLAALASATAPASTLMTIRQTGAKGDFVDTLLQVVALDDVVSLVAYSVAISLAVASLGSGGISAGVVLRPILFNAAVFLLGGIFGVILTVLFMKRSTDNRLIVTLAMLFAFCGICALLDVSPLLGCMSMGTVYVNLSDDEKLFRQLNYFNPPILLLFFVYSGMNFRLDALFGSENTLGSVPLLLIGVLYLVIRVFGKYLGAWLGCLLTRRPAGTRRFLGLGLVPQAGVAIGLSAMAARVIGGAAGADLQTVILASSVLYELIGPPCAKLGLFLSGSYSNDLDDVAPVAAEDGKPPLSDAERLAEQIRRITKEAEKHKTPAEENEDAFTEAAYEYQSMRLGRRDRWSRDRRK